MDNLLFYRVGDGLAAVGHIKDGKFENTDTQHFSTGWSQIVVVEDQLLFYRASDGLAAVGHIKDGKFENTDSQNFSTGWSQIIATA